MSEFNSILELSTQLMRPLIYYFSEDIFPEVKEEHIKKSKETGLINTLVLADYKGEIHFFDNKIEQVELLKKEKVLKSNILNLIEFKAKHDKETFVYQFENYLSDVDVWVETTNYIKKHAKAETSNYFDEIQPYLDLQYDVLKAHRTELQQRFAEFKIMPFKQSDKQESDLTVQLNLNEIEESTPLRDIKKKAKTEKKKVALPDDETIDQFLLETVFGLDFSKVSTKNQKNNII